MFRKVPVIGHPISLSGLFSALFRRDPVAGFEQAIKDEVVVRHALSMNTGIASFYVILSVLKKLSRAREVILPAYTAPSLVVAVRRAGLIPVLCDISLDDFNASLDDMCRRMNENTLCAVAVHMFGIPWVGIEGLNKKRALKNIFIVEDCAQSFGARIRGAFVGTFGDINFFSFNRGKNLPTYEGGCIVTGSDELAAALDKEAALYPRAGLTGQMVLGAKLAAVSLAFRPFFYGLLCLLISRFKDNSVPAGFQVERFSGYPAAVGAGLLKKSPGPFKRRKENAEMLLEALKSAQGVLLPKISAGIEPVFNRLPIVIKDCGKVEGIIKALEDAGIESSRFYLKPLHHIFDLGYDKEEFPNSVYFAQRLITLPVHPYVGRQDIEKMVSVIKEMTGDNK